MAFDRTPMTRPALMTAAAALALYHDASPSNPASVAAAADALAAVIQANLAKLTPKAPKVAPMGLRVDLARVLTTFAKVMDRKSTVPVLANVKLEALGDRLTLTASDMEMEIASTVSAPGIGVWATTVPHDALTKLIAKGAGDVIMAPADDQLEVLVGNAMSKLAALPAGDFPVMSAPQTENAFTMAGADLKALLKFVRPAISTEETRYYLNGAYLHTVFDQGRPLLRAVSTDGHRLHLDDMAAPEEADFAGIIIPRKAVDVLIAMLGAGDALVQVNSTESHGKLRVTSNGFCLTTKLIDGAFPDYMRVIPRNNETIYDLASADLKDATTRVRAVAGKDSTSVKLVFGADKLTLTCRNGQGGVAEETVPADRDPAGDDEVTIGFNASYVLEALAALGADRVQLHMQESSSPTLYRDKATPSRVIVLMPLRV